MKQLAVALLSFGSLAPALLPTPTLADTVVLRGGRALDGELLTYDEKSQEFRVKPKEGGLLTLRRGDVERTLCSETRARATTPRAAKPAPARRPPVSSATLPAPHSTPPPATANALPARSP